MVRRAARSSTAFRDSDAVHGLLQPVPPVRAGASLPRIARPPASMGSSSPICPPKRATSCWPRCRRHGLDLIFLLAPTTTDERHRGGRRARQRVHLLRLADRRHRRSDRFADDLRDYHRAGPRPHRPAAGDRVRHLDPGARAAGRRGRRRRHRRRRADQLPGYGSGRRPAGARRSSSCAVCAARRRSQPQVSDESWTGSRSESDGRRTPADNRAEPERAVQRTSPAAASAARRRSRPTPPRTSSRRPPSCCDASSALNDIAAGGRRQRDLHDHARSHRHLPGPGRARDWLDRGSAAVQPTRWTFPARSRGVVRVLLHVNTTAHAVRDSARLPRGRAALRPEWAYDDAQLSADPRPRDRDVRNEGLVPARPAAPHRPVRRRAMIVVMETGADPRAGRRRRRAGQGARPRRPPLRGRGAHHHRRRRLTAAADARRDARRSTGVERVVRITKKYKLTGWDFHPQKTDHPVARRRDRRRRGRRSSPGRARSKARSRRSRPRGRSRPPAPRSCAAAPTSRAPRRTSSAGSAERAGDSGHGPRGDRPADHHRGDDAGRHRDGRRVHRHLPDRRPQLPELLSAGGGRQGRQAGHAQARPVAC